jgi:hypothetical protein
MKYFQVSIYLTENLDDKFWELIPQHREMISELMLDEKVITYAINIERSKGWLTITADNLKEVRNVLLAFPIIDYMTYEIDELFIFDSTSTQPQLILN